MSDHLQEIIRRPRAGEMQSHSVDPNRTRDGRIITCAWFNTPLREADGRFAGLICGTSQDGASFEPMV